MNHLTLVPPSSDAPVKGEALDRHAFYEAYLDGNDVLCVVESATDGHEHSEREVAHLADLIPDWIFFAVEVKS